MLYSLKLLNHENKLSGSDTPMLVGWSLAALFFVSTVLFAVLAARLFLQQKPLDTNEQPEHEYVDNIIQPPMSSPGMPDETFYNNQELYEL